jgi:hypothetical protein
MELLDKDQMSAKLAQISRQELSAKGGAQNLEARKEIRRQRSKSGSLLPALCSLRFASTRWLDRSFEPPLK